MLDRRHVEDCAEDMLRTEAHEQGEQKKRDDQRADQQPRLGRGAAVLREMQGGCEEGAFFHFQTWKRQYKTLAYGSPELPALRGGRHWRASPEGLLPVVAPDGALDRGLNLSEGGLLTG